MKIFIDSADLDEIKQVYEWGVADGVTTNPSLLKKAVDKRKKINLKKYISQILKTAINTPVSLEVTTTTAKEMINEGKKLYKLFNPIAKNVYIKIPINPSLKNSNKTHFDGIQAIKTLTKAKIPVNCTLIFTPEQALLAAKAGASFVSPFAGRIDDFIRKNYNITFEKTNYYPSYGWNQEGHILEDKGIVSGIDLVKQIVTIFQNHNINTEVLAASMRNPHQVREAALVGANIATLPLKVIQEMLKHPKTFEGMNKFTQDIVPEYQKIK